MLVFFLSFCSLCSDWIRSDKDADVFDIGLGRVFGKNTIARFKPSDFGVIDDTQFVALASTDSMQFSNIRVTDGSEPQVRLFSFALLGVFL